MFIVLRSLFLMSATSPSPQRTVDMEITPNTVSNVRVSNIRPLLPPACLDEMLPLSSEAAATVERGRADVQAVIEVISFTAKHCA